MIVAYLAAGLVSSFGAARHRSWTLIPVLPLVFAVFHVAYGTGFLAGAAHWGLRRAPSDVKQGGLFSRLTR